MSKNLTIDEITAIATTAAIAAVQAHLAQISAPIDLAEPAVAKASKARKPAKKAPAKCLVKKNRAEFVKAHPWAAGLSTLDIAIAVVHLGADLTPAWTIGEGYTAKAQTATKAAIKAVKALV